MMLIFIFKGADIQNEAPGFQIDLVEALTSKAKRAQREGEEEGL